MRIQTITLAALAFISAPSWSAFQEREYNTWYIKNAVLYDMTQTSEGFPVMVSISQPARRRPICWCPTYPLDNVVRTGKSLTSMARCFLHNITVFRWESTELSIFQYWTLTALIVW